MQHARGLTTAQAGLARRIDTSGAMLCSQRGNRDGGAVGWCPRGLQHDTWHFMPPGRAAWSSRHVFNRAIQISSTAAAMCIVQAQVHRVPCCSPSGLSVSMQVSEACVKRCGPTFHEQLAISHFFERIKQAIMEPNSARVCPSDIAMRLVHMAGTVAVEHVR